MGEHLVYEDGHLLLTASGHLANACPDATNPQDVTCTGCATPLYRNYTITWSGLGGSFSAYNGAHTLEYFGKTTNVCFWYEDKVFEAPVRLQFQISPAQWTASININILCYIFARPAVHDPCVVKGTYTRAVCNQTWCSGSCSASPSAQAIIADWNPAP